jgi:hypothetical protein
MMLLGDLKVNDEHLLQSLKTTAENLKNTADSLEKTANQFHQTTQSLLTRIRNRKK